MELRIKRIYDTPSDSNGIRILVDRLWPRGVSKERAKLDLWLKEITPSTELRKWYGHKPERHEEFKKLYRQELMEDPVHQEKVDYVCKLLKEDDVTILYAAKDPKHNHAIILKEYILEQLN